MAMAGLAVKDYKELTYTDIKKGRIPGLSISDVEPSKRVTATDSNKGPRVRIVTGDDLDKAIADSCEQRIKGVAELSLDSMLASVQCIEVLNDKLRLQIDVPFIVPLDSPCRREIEALRHDFAACLMSERSEDELSKLFHQILINSLLPRCQNCSPVLQKRLNRISQHLSAGRTRHRIPPALRERVCTLGRSISRTIPEIRGKIETWSRNGKNLTDATATKRIRKTFPSTKHPWIEDFLSLKSLPRRRNASGDEAERLEGADRAGNLPPCSLAQAKQWSILGAILKTLQKVLIKETGITYPLHEIKAVIKSQQQT